MSPLRRLATCDPVLLRRSRYGDGTATRSLASRHLDRIALLASVVGSTPQESEALVRKGFDLAMHVSRHCTGPFDDALVRAFAQLAASGPEPAAAASRLAQLLTEVECRSAHDVERLLGSAAGGHPAFPFPVRPCRGWGLASGRPGLTAAEREAGSSHLALCRRCRERLDAVERTRAQLLGSSAGVVGAVALAQVVPLGSGTAGGLGVLVTGKTAAGVVASVGAAVLATGGVAVATAPPHPHHPTPRPATVRPTDRPVAVVPSEPRPAQPVPPATTRPAEPKPVPSRLRVPLPTTVLPGQVPPVPVPVPVPLPVPSLPPLPVAPPARPTLPLVSPL